MNNTLLLIIWITGVLGVLSLIYGIYLLVADKENIYKRKVGIIYIYFAIVLLALSIVTFSTQLIYVFLYVLSVLLLLIGCMQRYKLFKAK